jgi:hypothetical protein
MKPNYAIVSAIVFTLVALLHALRLINGWPVQIGAWGIPELASWIGLAVTAALATWGFRVSRVR